MDHQNSSSSSSSSSSSDEGKPQATNNNLSRTTSPKHQNNHTEQQQQPQVGILVLPESKLYNSGEDDSQLTSPKKQFDYSPRIENMDVAGVDLDQNALRPSSFGTRDLSELLSKSAPSLSAAANGGAFNDSELVFKGNSSMLLSMGSKVSEVVTNTLGAKSPKTKTPKTPKSPIDEPKTPPPSNYAVLPLHSKTIMSPSTTPKHYQPKASDDEEF